MMNIFKAKTPSAPASPCPTDKPKVFRSTLRIYLADETEIKILTQDHIYIFQTTNRDHGILRDKITRFTIELTEEGE